MNKSCFAIITTIAAIAIILVAPWTLISAGIDYERASSNLTYGYKVINVYPHDRSAFTQGLVYDSGVLYEGTGHYGRSELRMVDLETGLVQKRISLPTELFGEGIAVWEDRLVQLTWKSKVGLVYDKESLNKTGNFTYQTEGWGITSDGKRLIMSDGTDRLYFLDPETFQVLGQIEVRDGGTAIRGINELEYVQGDIYANIWPTNRIAIISPETGLVRAWIDLTGLLPESDRAGTDVLNGIAYDAEGDRLFVTGKYWPSLFEIDLVAKDK
ncbi:MAG: glutaminyl-peptide cyclotransferase [Methanotrichaceae archaeon]|nr:glutaminyl-peptide cyclotransferase [Methanotrichaceae archaeon]